MEYVKFGTLLASLLSILALFSVHRSNRKQNLLEGSVNRKQTETENRLNRQHAETLAAVNHSYSKEAHAANHLYTRKASHLESAGKIVGDLQFWGEKCVVPRTRTDFGTKQEIASNMSKAFENLSQYTMQYPFAFKKIGDLQQYMLNLMDSVNYIENMAHTDNFGADSEAWKSAGKRFQQELGPITAALQREIEALMQQI